MPEYVSQTKYPLVVGANDPCLRAIAQPVWQLTKEVLIFGKDLKELMWTYDGVGLAAPQVGKSVRMFAFSQRDTSKKKRKLLHEWVMINPEIIALSDELCVEEEGCLSLPGVKGDVARPTRVVMKYTDLDKKIKSIKSYGYNARILLHELDHLNGILFIDKTEKN